MKRCTLTLVGLFLILIALFLSVSKGWEFRKEEEKGKTTSAKTDRPVTTKVSGRGEKHKVTLSGFKSAWAE
jgi:hypothetical protein